VTVLNTGATRKYVEGWELVFGKKRNRSSGGKKAAARPAARKSAKTKKR
jgi:hypothetical protein